MALLQVLLGILALIAGRHLFWLFVGIVGFRVGLRVGAQLVPDASDWMVVLVALGIGILGALLAIVLQHIVVGVAGFVAGGEIATDFLRLSSAEGESMWWMLFIIGGLVGLVLVLMLFDWALIVLSAFIGAGLVARGLALSPDAEAMVFVVLFLVGFVVQAVLMRRSRAPAHV